jgi:adenosylcobyric acid synthase
MVKSIMIQGTMSNVGKSLLTAGLCRIFTQDGLKTAPFKSQNMALNSFITTEGLEMGRAQAVQAEAAGIVPSVRMNPILLKPTNDTGSQVIVNGEVLRNMGAKEYFAYKKQLLPVIHTAYAALAAEYETIVIEGAGSPAEINLKEDDIVNMGMAQMAKAPVLLVGDIDRGGVFAQLIGTISLLSADERKLVKGLIINKFRGDRSLLDSGVKTLEEMTGIPVVGVLPYMDVDIEEEDSLTERFTRWENAANHFVPTAMVEIAVIRMPRISNITDFHVLESMSGISLRYVTHYHQLGHPDMIILPGTKNTMADLLWFRSSGLEAAVLKEKERGAVIFGICGGYQMLGEKLSDPEQVEQGGELRGMGLLPIETVFTNDKTRTQVAGAFGQLLGVLKPLSGVNISGYEIHMGASVLKEGQKAVTKIKNILREDGELWQDGAQSDLVYGSYVHGIFDEEQVAVTLQNALAKKKGICFDQHPQLQYAAYKEKQFNILADTMRQYLDMKKIHEILNEGEPHENRTGKY